MMITGEELYKVISSMVPLYVAMALGYISVKWCRMFNSNQCDAINRFNCYFLIPFFTFYFTSTVNPYKMNFRYLAGDVVSKAIVGIALILWVTLCRKSKSSWAITIFSLSCFNNTLVVGVPLLNAMYGSLGQDLVIQSSVLQFLVWVPLLLFLFEFRRAYSMNKIMDNNLSPQPEQQKNENNDSIINVDIDDGRRVAPPSNDLRSTMKKVCAKLATNPNTYASALGIIWTLIANRWSIDMPKIVEGSIRIMGDAGSGVSMFTIGLFMGLQHKVVPCGIPLALGGMFLRFVIGPVTTAIGCLAIGLRSEVLGIAIIQAALPEAIVGFVFAKEYNLHADVLSASIIFGTIASLPLLTGYYVVLSIAQC